jgi:heme exporter protein C
MYVAFGITALCSALYLFPRTRKRTWDLLAGAAAEVGVIFTALVLITGSIWGRPTWGVWWTWDARLTSTALLFVLFLGYLALRRLPSDAHTSAKRSAIAALIAAADVPIVHFSVEWWRTLHQEATLEPGEVSIHGSQLVTMLLSFPVMGLILAWLLIHRFRMEQLADEHQTSALDRALEERRAEGRRVNSFDSVSAKAGSSVGVDQ